MSRRAVRASKPLRKHFHLLSFEGPDPYARAGGLASRVTGLSQQLAALGHETDLWFVGDPAALAKYSSLDIVREAGAQGFELVNWIAARGALTGDVVKVHAHYHVPISNTATGLMVLENRPGALARAA